MINFKHDKDMILFSSLHPLLIMVFSDLAWYAKSRHQVELTVTETITTEKEDAKLNRTSSSHRECRALDFRTKDIDAFIVADLIKYINNKPEYNHLKYMSNSGQTRLAYWHNSGHGDHVHLAIHSNFAIKSE